MKKKRSKALLEIGYKDETDLQNCTERNELTYQHICDQAEDLYRVRKDKEEWPPATILRKCSR